MQATKTDNIIKENYPLVVRIAKLFKPKNENEFDEYIQAGLIGLWKAIKKHDEKKGKFSTIAWYYIKYGIMDFIKNNKFHKSVEFEHLLDKHENTISVKQKESINDYLPNELNIDEVKLINMIKDGFTLNDIVLEFKTTRDEIKSLIKNSIKKIRDINEV